MNRKNIAKLFAAVLLLSATVPNEGAVQGKAAVQPEAKKAVSEPTYTVLNPEAQLPEIDTKALSPRLSSFAGKTIVIYDGRGGYEKPMQGLADQLKPLLPPDTKLIYYTPTSGADRSKIPDGDAVIVGHAY
jgi:hypothetical protein